MNDIEQGLKDVADGIQEHGDAEAAGDKNAVEAAEAKTLEAAFGVLERFLVDVRRIADAAERIAEES